MREAFEDRALCRGRDLEMWFPHDSENTVRSEALQWCRGCPVRLACLLSELDREGSAAAGSRYGVRGACTPQQRRRLYKVRAGLPCSQADRQLAAVMLVDSPPQVLAEFTDRQRAA